MYSLDRSSRGLSRGNWAMEFSTDSGMLTVRLTERRLDASLAPACKDAVTRHVTDRPRRVLVDAGLVDFIDSTGLGILIFLLKQMGDGGRIVVADAKPAVRRLIQMTKLDSIFTLSDSLEGAAIALQA